MRMRRYFVKMVKTYVVYDRVTGTIIGSTTSNEEVAKRVLSPKSLGVDDLVPDEAAVLIPYGSEEDFHNEIVRLMYATADDKVAIKSSSKKL